MSEQAIIEGMRRVEAFNNQFRQPNPNGRYPVCKPRLRSRMCERCGENIIESHPCPAVPRKQRWGADYQQQGEL